MIYSPFGSSTFRLGIAGMSDPQFEAGLDLVGFTGRRARARAISPLDPPARARYRFSRQASEREPAT